MTPAEVFFGSPDFKRGKYGWAEIAQTDGGTGLYRRATTVAGYLDDKEGLVSWTAAMVAFGMAKSPAMLANFQLLDWHDDKSKVKEMLAKAKDLGGGSEAADMGTAFHKVVEMFHQGQTIDRDTLPPNFAETLAAYERFLEDWGLACVGTEVKIVDDENAIAGTADLALKFRKDVETPFGTIKAGEGFIGDVKTGSVSSYSGLSMGMQLSIYSHGKPYDVLSGERTAWPTPEWNPRIGLILKVDVKNHSITPWWLDLSTAHELVGLAMQVSKVRSSGRKMIAEGAAPAPAPEAKPDLQFKDRAAELNTTPEPAPEKTDPLPPLEVVSIEDQAPAPTPEPEAEKSRAELIAEEAEALPNVGAAREAYKKWRREGASAEELLPIANRAAALGATMKGQ